MANVLVTGSNRGIGLELCRQLQQRGDQVIAACRSPSPSLEKLGVRVETNTDVVDQASIDALAKRLEGVRLDLLINNAGLLTHESIEDMDFDRVRKQFEVNSIGPLRVTLALLKNLRKGAKVAIITSRMGSIGDNTSGGRYGYRMSKAAVNIAGVSLARDLLAREIAVGIIHPGFVRTDMTGQSGMIDPPESVAGILKRVGELTLDNSGGFWHANGEVLPW